jgi:uncharacterized membrane-anchored protein
MKKTLLIIVSLGIFAVFNYAIYEKEQIKANGETVLLELAPVDPRSLVQGDYMRLRYAIERNQSYQAEKKRGYMVVSLDSNKVATFSRFHNGEPLASNEKLLHFHNQYGNLRIVPDSFMFQEGHAKFYQTAKYGVFKFDNSGNHLLVGLADDKHQIIQPN